MKNHLGEAKRWYDQAWNDWEFVIWLSKEDKFYDKGCFIIQQACEKVLKACLFASGERFIPEHSNFELISRLKKYDAIFKTLLDNSKRIDRFYIPTRYPDGLPGGAPYQHFTKVDFETARNDGKMIIEQCQKFLKKKNVSLM